MSRRIPQETIQKMQKMYFGQGMPVKQIATAMDMCYATVYGFTRGVERGFKTSRDYHVYLVQERGFKSYRNYVSKLLRKMGYESETEYLTYLAGRNGFVSLHAYKTHLAQERQQMPENRRFAHTITEHLTETGKTRKQLARQIGVSKQTVIRYAQGKNIPKGDNLKRVLSVIGAA